MTTTANPFETVNEAFVPPSIFGAEAQTGMGMDDATFEFGDEDFDFVSKITDASVLPPKTEALIQIVDVLKAKDRDNIVRIIREDKNGRSFVFFRLKIADVPAIGNFNPADYKVMKYMLYIPKREKYGKDAEGLEKFTEHGRTWKHFMTAFGINLSKKINFLDMIGKTATAILGVEESEQYGNTNRVTKWVITH